MKYQKVFRSFFFVCFLVGITACSTDDDENLVAANQNECSMHTIPLDFVGYVCNYDSSDAHNKDQALDSQTSIWNDGDMIYITFYNKYESFPGIATYSSSSGWTINYEGDLMIGDDLRCEARYFVNATFSNTFLVSINSNTEIYEDANATYTYSDNALRVVATLTPKVGRIRFTGTPDETIHLTGLSVYTTYSPGTNSFSSSSAVITTTVDSDGSTPYIYCTFTYEDQTIGLVGVDYAYTRTCTSDVLKAGESGYMTIPSEESHNNWRRGLCLKVSGVEFKMIPVTGFSEGFFLIGETETTKSLYYSVIGQESFSMDPMSSVYYSSILSFINKLNTITRLNFSLPTKDQWQYAASGGDISQGYTYAGSNNPDDVAWYKDNCTDLQPVKTKAPNELGIYDMSGNVGEYVTKEENYIICGGSYRSDFSKVDVNSWVDYSNDCSSGIYGFRMILVFP